jgi:hypothetical protein
MGNTASSGIVRRTREKAQRRVIAGDGSIGTSVRPFDCFGSMPSILMIRLTSDTLNRKLLIVELCCALVAYGTGVYLWSSPNWSPATPL